MTNIKFSNIITTALAAGMGMIILFWPNLGLNSPSQIKLICDGINSILTAINANVKFTPNNILYSIVSMEYVIFGILLMIALRSYTKNIAKNMFIPLFIGLITAIASGYLTNLMRMGNAGLDVVIYEFIYLVIGILIYLLVNKISRGHYSRRR